MPQLNFGIQKRITNNDENSDPGNHPNFYNEIVLTNSRQLFILTVRNDPPCCAGYTQGTFLLRGHIPLTWHDIHRGHIWENQTCPVHTHYIVFQ